MKKTAHLFILALLAISLNKANCQTIIGVVNYMNVPDEEAYLQLEKEWEKVHQVRLEEGMIIAWAVNKVMFKTVEDPYNYVTISWYDSFSKLDQDIPDEVFEAAFPEKSEDEIAEFQERTNQLRNLVAEGVFHQRLTCKEGINLVGKYFVITEISVKAGKSREFLNLSEDVYLPVFYEELKDGHRTAWSVWEKWPGNMKEFQFLTADGYMHLDQIQSDFFAKNFKKVHPQGDMEEVSSKMEDLRTLVNSEMWKLMYSVTD